MVNEVILNEITDVAFFTKFSFNCLIFKIVTKYVLKHFKLPVGGYQSIMN